MILYLDTSALVKRYVAEPGSTEVAQAIETAQASGTSILTRAEMAAALGKAVRVHILNHDAAASALQTFHEDWPGLIHVQVTEHVVARAGRLAWDLGLCGYDAVHLAAALLWQEGMGEGITFATFDQRLWTAAGQSGLTAIPRDLPNLIASWRGSNVDERWS